MSKKYFPKEKNISPFSKLGNFGYQVNSHIHLQTVEIQMRRLLMSRLISTFTICLFNLFFIPIIEIQDKRGCCPNIADCQNLPDFTIFFGTSSVIEHGLASLESIVLLSRACNPASASGKLQTYIYKQWKSRLDGS